ncbi:MAG: transmembrane Mn(2+) transporter, partial [Planctomycetaceae bacterium]|nr:transmembrane Mn(2+) transporter [Planctomycetaceae bacterium]
TAALLVNGRYGIVQSVSTVLVAAFTVITVFSFFGLQSDTRWHTGWSDLQRGLSLGLPGDTPDERRAALGTALAAFGIIGVGASELIAYPYWCLEKGYARWTGPRNDSPEWAHRAAGWLRVMKWDAFCSMCVFTTATAAFYLLGAAVLHRQGLNPDNDQMIPTLEKM